jgi:hypothetical protein
VDLFCAFLLLLVLLLLSSGTVNRHFSQRSHGPTTAMVGELRLGLARSSRAVFLLYLFCRKKGKEYVSFDFRTRAIAISSVWCVSIDGWRPSKQRKKKLRKNRKEMTDCVWKHRKSLNVSLNSFFLVSKRDRSFFFCL